MKNYSKYKIGLLSFLMAGVGLINADCVSLDKYVAPNGRKIYLLGDWHRSTRNRAQKEQDAFIKAAKERGAYCIIEDIWDYRGDNYQVRQRMDDICYEEIVKGNDQFRYPVTALTGLAGRCAASNIPYFNAEYRHVFNLMGSGSDANEIIGDEIDKMTDEVRTYRDRAIAYSDFLPTCADRGLDNHIKQKLGKLNFKNTMHMSMQLFNARIVHCLYELLSDSEDQRDIFIFAGADHIRFIDEQMNIYFRCSKVYHPGGPVGFDSLKQHKDTSNDRLRDQFKKDKLSVTSGAHAMSQEQAATVVDRYAVDIGLFFERDGANEQREAQNRVSSELILSELKKLLFTSMMAGRAYNMKKI